MTVYFILRCMFADCAFDGEPLKKQELWKTASLDRNPQLNPEHVAKRSAIWIPGLSHIAVKIVHFSS